MTESREINFQAQEMDAAQIQAINPSHDYVSLEAINNHISQLQQVAQNEEVYVLLNKMVQDLQSQAVPGCNIYVKKYAMQFFHICKRKEAFCKNQKTCRICKYSLYEKCKGNKYLQRRYYCEPNVKQSVPLVSACQQGLILRVIQFDDRGQIAQHVPSFSVEVSLVVANQERNSDSELSEESASEQLQGVGLRLTEDQEPALTIQVSFIQGIVNLERLQLVISEDVQLNKLPPLSLRARYLGGPKILLAQSSIISRSFKIVSELEREMYLQSDFPGAFDEIYKLDDMKHESLVTDGNNQNVLIIKNLNVEQFEYLMKSNLCKMDRDSGKWIVSVSKVGELYSVMRYCEERDNEFKESICEELNWSQSTWSQIWKQVKYAVLPDQRRIWKLRNNPTEGLIYSCPNGVFITNSNGEIDPPQARWLSGQEVPLDTLNKNLFQAHRRALKDWQEDGHPNWEAYNLPNKHLADNNRQPMKGKQQVFPGTKIPINMGKSPCIQNHHSKSVYRDEEQHLVQNLSEPTVPEYVKMEVDPEVPAGNQGDRLLAMQWKTFVSIVAAMRDFERGYSNVDDECFEKVKELSESGFLNRCLEAILQEMIGNNEGSTEQYDDTNTLPENVTQQLEDDSYVSTKVIQSSPIDIPPVSVSIQNDIPQLQQQQVNDSEAMVCTQMCVQDQSQDMALVDIKEEPQ